MAASGGQAWRFGAAGLATGLAVAVAASSPARPDCGGESVSPLRYGETGRAVGVEFTHRAQGEACVQ